MNTEVLAAFKRSGMHRIMSEHAHEYGNGTFEQTEYQELDKFVEMIVHMCTDTVGFAMDHTEYPDNAEHSRIELEAYTWARAAIKERFTKK